eukprot:gene20173-125_t
MGQKASHGENGHTKHGHSHRSRPTFPTEPRASSPLCSLDQTFRDQTFEEAYEISRRKLGEGGFGQVVLAECRRTKKRRAVKCVSKQFVARMGFSKYIMREIEYLRNIVHTNVVRCYDVKESDKMWYLIMEYASGGELFDSIYNSPSR